MQTFRLSFFCNKESASTEEIQTAVERLDLIWMTDDSSVATVDENGRISGVSSGETIITVQSDDGSLMAETKVVVTTRPQSIKAKDMIIHTLDRGIDVLFDVYPMDAVIDTVDIRSMDDSVVIVAGGRVSAVAAGNTELIITVDNISETVNLTVLQAPVELSAEDAELEEGESGQITVGFGVDVVDIGSALVFESADTNIAMVSPEGVITGVKAGATTIFFENELGQRGEMTVTVIAKEIKPQSVTVGAVTQDTPVSAPAVDEPIVNEPVIEEPVPIPEPAKTCPVCGATDHTSHPQETPPPNYDDNSETIQNQTQPGFGEDHEIGEDY